MNHFLTRIVAWASALILLGPAFLSSAVAAETIVTRTVEGAFEDVLLDVENAIIGQGLKITYRADIAGMLERTGKDLGAKETIYKGGQVLQFCSAKLSRMAMLTDARNIAFCPYGVFVYESARELGRVVVGYRRLPAADAASEASRKALEAVNRLLETIVREATAF